MRVLLLVSLLSCMVWQCALAQDDDARAPNRGLLKRGLLAKGKQTTTTTPAPPPKDEVEYEDEAEYQDEAQEPSTEAAPSSTEGKKLVAGGVRPFRSNADLLEALKRRRAQAAEAKLQAHSNSGSLQAQESGTDAPSKASYNTKKRYNTAVREANNEEAPVAPKPSRGRFGRPSSRSIQEEPEEQSESAPPPVTRNARTFARPRGN